MAEAPTGIIPGDQCARTAAAPGPSVTCVPSKLDPSIIDCSDGRSLRFDWNALLEILERPRLHLLAER